MNGAVLAAEELRDADLKVEQDRVVLHAMTRLDARRAQLALRLGPRLADQAHEAVGMHDTHPRPDHRHNGAAA